MRLFQARDGDHIALVQRARTSRHSDGRLAVAQRRRVRRIGAIRTAAGVRRPQRILDEIEAGGAPHIAFAILLGDLRRIVEQAFERIDQVHIILRVQVRGPIVERRQRILQDLPPGQQLREGRR